MMRYLMIGMIAVILAVLAAAFWLAPQHMAPQAPSSTSGKALIGGDFSMTTHTGAPYTQKDLLGHYSLIYFGFTHCPDICPTSLMVMTNAINSLNDAGQNITPVFVSVDPERDNQALLAQYVTNFHPRMIGLHGTAEQTKQIADAYKVYYNRVEQPDSALKYLIDHSGHIYLMDPKGEYLTHFPHNVAEQTLAATLRQYTNP